MWKLADNKEEANKGSILLSQPNSTNDEVRKASEILQLSVDIFRTQAVRSMNMFLIPADINYITLSTGAGATAQQTNPPSCSAAIPCEH